MGSVLSWRTRRQFVDPPAGGGPVEVARRLAGVQPQVTSATELTVAVRQAHPRPGAVAAALADRTLVKTWATRGTLHLLPTGDAAACTLRSLSEAFVGLVPGFGRVRIDRPDSMFRYFGSSGEW